MNKKELKLLNEKKEFVAKQLKYCAYCGISFEEGLIEHSKRVHNE